MLGPLVDLFVLNHVEARSGLPQFEDPSLRRTLYGIIAALSFFDINAEARHQLQWVSQRLGHCGAQRLLGGFHVDSRTILPQSLLTIADLRHRVSPCPCWPELPRSATRLGSRHGDCIPTSMTCASYVQRIHDDDGAVGKKVMMLKVRTLMMIGLAEASKVVPSFRGATSTFQASRKVPGDWIPTR